MVVIIILYKINLKGPQSTADLPEWTPTPLHLAVLIYSLKHIDKFYLWQVLEIWHLSRNYKKSHWSTVGMKM